MPEALAAVEAGFRDYARGQAKLLPRISQTLPGTAGMFRILAATLPTRKMFGLKTLTGYPRKRLENETYFTILLFETGSGALRAVVSANPFAGAAYRRGQWSSGKVSRARRRSFAGYRWCRSSSLVPSAGTNGCSEHPDGKNLLPGQGQSRSVCLTLAQELCHRCRRC
jgi:hypothetical protein